MKKQARIKDIAHKAGVSSGTVDRVLHNRGEVSPATRKKILQIIQELDYHPNLLASTLASKKTIRFAVLIPAGGPDNPYWDAPMKGILRAAEEIRPFGVQTELLTFAPDNPAKFRQQARMLLDNPPAALLLAPVLYTESGRFLQQCGEAGLPVVFVDSEMDYPHTVQVIAQNACQSGQVAAKLLGIGQQPDASYLICNIIGDRDQLHHFSERGRGFSSWFRQNQLPVDMRTLDLEGNEQSIQNQLLASIDDIKKADGIFVTGSKAYQMARFLKKNKLQTIRLVGYDLVEANIAGLEDGIIDFLISQKPEEQGYIGMKALYACCVQHQIPEPRIHTAIDIITKENLKHYLHCP